MSINPVRPALPITDTLLAHLRDGVVRLDVRGQVLSVNPAAQLWLRELLARTGQLRSLCTAAMRKQMVLPAQLNLFEYCAGCQNVPKSVWFDRDGPSGFYLIITPADVSAPQLGSRAYEDFMGLLDADAINDIRNLHQLLLNLNGLPEEIQPHVLELSSLLDEVGNVAELYQRDLVFTDERFGLAPLMAEIMRELPLRVGSATPHYSYTEGESIGQIYGHRSWMKQALFSLLARFGQSCPQGYSVRVSLRQLGDFVIVSGRCLVDRERSRGVVTANGARLIGNKAPPEKLGVSLRVTKRIFDLHGGTLKSCHYTQHQDCRVTC